MLFAVDCSVALTLSRTLPVLLSSDGGVPMNSPCDCFVNHNNVVIYPASNVNA
jgi:hypothetical protein